jgi:capsular polysaccharide biosynthesis protein
LDHFITQFGGLPFQYETLAMLGIGKEKIVASNENHNFHIKAETLYVPSLAGPLDVPTNFQINFLRSLYKKYLKQRNPEKRIYLSRKKVGTRNIVNEAELINALKIYQFEVVECEERSVADQAQLFSEASIIISSHGSALTNLVFCNPGAVVIDIFNESHINPCFWFISQINKLNYHYLCGRPIKIDNNRKNDHTILDMALFNKKMSMLGFPL